MKLYHSTRAPNPERVVFFLRAKGILDKVDLEDVSIMKGEHLSEAYRAISPFAKVPALQLDDGTVITESRAICTYLEGVFPEVNLLGNDPKERALIEMWERQLDFMLDAAICNLVPQFSSSHGSAREAAASRCCLERRAKRKSICSPPR